MRAAGRVRRGVWFVLAILGIAALGLAAWLGYAEHARAARETRSVEELAAGRGRWVQVADADLYVQEWGNPGLPTVLLTHGTGAWSGTWFGLPNALVAAGWRVMAVDLPPFGLSKTTVAGIRADYSRPAQARRLLDLINSLATPVSLVGHSFGSGPALEAALQAGGRLRQLVLVDPALGLGPNGEAPRCDPGSGAEVWMAQRPLRTLLISATATWPGFTDTLLKQFVYRKEMVTDPLLPAYQVPFQRKRFSAALGDWAMAFARAGCESAGSLDPMQLAQWSANGPPVTLIWGEQDTVTPLAQGRALTAWMPRATLVVLPGVGHIPHIENPRVFADTLVDVLKQPAR